MHLCRNKLAGFYSRKAGLSYLWRQMLRKNSFLTFLIVLVVGGACLDDPDCVNRNNNVITIDFKNRDGQAINVAIDSVMISGTDSVFYRNSSLSAMPIALNYFAEETIVTFDIPGDTLEFKFNYNTQTQYVSEDCGERYILSGLNVTGIDNADHPFDSVRILNTFPASDSTSKTLEIYFF